MEWKLHPRTSRNYILDASNLSSPMKLELHPRCISTCIGMNFSNNHQEIWLSQNYAVYLQADISEGDGL